MNKKNKTLILTLLCALYFLSYGVNAKKSRAIVADTQTPEALIKALQKGGYIMYMRHGKTLRKDKSRDSLQIDFTQCNTQRNLSESGIIELQNIGRALKKLNIPIGEVKSSPYCRTKDTAALVYGDYIIDEKLAFSIAKEDLESAMLGEYLFNSMQVSNDVIKNTVFVGHTANLKDGLGVWPKPEGVVVVFKKEGNKIIYRGMIKPTDWVDFAYK